MRGEMSWIADYFKTWNWEAGFRYSRNEGKNVSIGEVSQPGLRQALLDTDPATAFDPFLNISGLNTAAARAQVYVNLQNTGEYELPIYYATFNGDLFNLPAGPVSFAIGGEYDAPRFTRDRDALNTTFETIGSVDGQSFRVNRDVWAIYQEVRVPFTSPTWNFPGFYTLEVDFAEREEWGSSNTSTVLEPFQPAAHSTYNAQKPKVSVRWQPLDPKYIGALTWELCRGVSRADTGRADTRRRAGLPVRRGSVYAHESPRIQDSRPGGGTHCWKPVPASGSGV